jgi:small-conductance mechanosensitive channel
MVLSLATKIRLVMLVMVIIVAIAVVSTDPIWQICSLIVLLGVTLLSARLIDRELNEREALGFYLIILVAVSTGSLIGAILSWSLHGAILSVSIVTSSFTYSVIALRAIQR